MSAKEKKTIDFEEHPKPEIDYFEREVDPKPVVDDHNEENNDSGE